MTTSGGKLPALAWVQSIYHTLTGIWPLVHNASFMRVTGPKTDVWLLRTVAGLLVATGLRLGLAGRRCRFTLELAVIAARQALALATVDVVYPLIGRISPVYLLDALPELALVTLWIAWYPRGGSNVGGRGAG